MPLIQVTMLKGRTIEQKHKLAARITDAIVEDAKAAKGVMGLFDYSL